MQTNAKWYFPLPRTHTGMLLGNGTTGLMVWGEGNHLKITIGRADLWDHRGGMQWTPKQNYVDMRRCLENNDLDGIKGLFQSDTEKEEGQPHRPSVIPVGRVDLLLPSGAELLEGNLELTTAKAKISYQQAGKTETITIQLAMNEQIAVIECSDMDNITIKNVPSWDFLGEYLSSILFKEPAMIESDTLGGWTQLLPVDPGLCVAHKTSGNTIWLGNKRGEDVSSLCQATEQMIDQAITAGISALESDNQQWWQNYWNGIPKITVPNECLDFIYSYGLYKFAGFTNPTGIAATLQGPWIEEYKMPPWSSDYHFNINVQMCYWPAYKANKLDHLMPLFDLVWSWKDKLQNNAKMFIGIDDGFMLPHAVDDHSVCMGGFWTGSIDHACTAWVAQMMYDYYVYSGDKAFLAEKAYPFMKGAMRVYEEMLEKNGDSYELPVSVSPEYRGAAMNAWGKNASFQLACIHRLCENLISASSMLDLPVNPAWQDINDNLPKTTLIGEPGHDGIALWEGTPLEESHRHHSHLAAICPFDAIDIYSEEWKPVISRSIQHWVRMGMGLWSGWCVPWASMIHSRLNNGNMAELILEMWERVYTNVGHGTLHDCDFVGLTVMGPISFERMGTELPEIMQMDAGMGAIVAVQDMFVHQRRGVLHLFNGTPKRWREFSVENMLCEGGFLVSGEMVNAKLASVSIKSKMGNPLRLGNPWNNQTVTATFANGKQLQLDGDVFEIPTNAGDVITLNVSR